MKAGRRCQLGVREMMLLLLPYAACLTRGLHAVQLLLTTVLLPSAPTTHSPALYQPVSPHCLVD
jgi:hypothetical protein